MEKRDLGYPTQPPPPVQYNQPPVQFNQPLAQYDQPPPYNPTMNVPVAGVSNPTFVQQQVPPQTVVVVQQQPQQQHQSHVPELLETESKDWFLFCGLGWFFGWCTACYLGQKYKVCLKVFPKH